MNNVTKPKRVCWLLVCITLAFLTGCGGSAQGLPPDKTQDSAVAEPQGAVYYVAVDGDNENPGTETQPWHTIQKAADTLMIGDVVYVRTGIYQERVVPQNSGNADNYIVYAAYPGETVTIDGTGITLPEWGGLFDLSEKSYIQVVGLRVINAGPHDNSVGILVDESSHVIIENNYTYNTVSSGIGVWNSDNVIVRRNEVELACNDGEQECITIAGTDTFEVSNNHVHHSGPGSNGGEGIDVKDGASNGLVFGNYVHHINRLGIYLDAWDKHTYNVEVFGNVAHNVSGDGFSLGSEAGGLLENIKVYNNIAYDNQYCGLYIHACCSELAPNHPLRNIEIINNTFYHNGDSWGGGIGIENPETENLTIRNNICSQNLSFQIADESGLPAEQLAIDHNLINGYREYSGETRGDDYIEGDPSFVDPAQSDFHLQSDSPAIDHASSVGAPGYDFEGHSRPLDTGYDIGADEYVYHTDFVYLPLVLKNYAGS